MAAKRSHDEGVAEHIPISILAPDGGSSVNLDRPRPLPTKKHVIRTQSTDTNPMLENNSFLSLQRVVYACSTATIDGAGQGCLSAKHEEEAPAGGGPIKGWGSKTGWWGAPFASNPSSEHCDR